MACLRGCALVVAVPEGRRVRWFAAATIACDLVEAVVALSAGAASSSGALIGFGLDSVVEVSSAAAVAWRFSAREDRIRRAREHRAPRVIALSFFALAACVVVDPVRALSSDGEAGGSPVGIALAALSLAVVPVLSTAQRRVGRELGSASAVADSRQTLLCSCPSEVLPVGLVLNAAPGWPWAGPVAALVIAVVALREGLREGLRERVPGPGSRARVSRPGFHDRQFRPSVSAVRFSRMRPG
ncbi:cation diffusion facilitator family transporter [Kineococcus sp. SYSU DK005]|uniref:cation transporter n=1 Tax=Kineococcus sp. SYSU DK005 TaxID=3383126 RepID=UPI003D7D7D38